MRGTILVVDDSVRPRHLLASELQEAGYAVAEAADGDEGWALFCRSEPDLVITDLVMPRADGHALLRRIRDHSDVPVIVFSAQESQEEAIRAFRAGADDFVSSTRVGVAELVDRAGGAVRSRPVDRPACAQTLAGDSDCMRRVRGRIAGLASLEDPVLVVGEPGTGRDTVVRALHESGSSAPGSIVRVDCASWEPSRGLPRASAVYLDGVEQLSPTAQAFWRDQLLGLAGPGKARPRVFASAGPLFESVSGADFDGTLREALARFPIRIDPLRERPEDIGPIADAIVCRLADTMGRPARLTDTARALLRDRPWRGNVRQLAQLLERAVAFSPGGVLAPDLLLELMDDIEDSLETIRRRGHQLERDTLLETLEHTGGNVTQTAEILGRSRGAVYRLMEKHGIAAAQLRSTSA